MKTKLSLIYFLIIFINSQLIGQIPDGGFNNWTTNSIGRLDLQDWTTDNLNYSAPTILQDVGQSGNGYSAKLVSVYDSSVGYFQGGLMQLIELPFSGAVRPNALLGFWKTFNPTNTDILIVDVQLYNSNMVEIGSGGIQTPFFGSISSWTQFTDPLTYTTGDSVAYYSILLFWTNLGGDPTSHAFLDDIHFDVSTEVVGTPSDLLGIKISEVNPGYYMLSSSTKYSDAFTVQVYDLNGKQLLTKKTNLEDKEHSQAFFDLSQMASGIYFCKVFNLSEYKTFKLIKL